MKVKARAMRRSLLTSRGWRSKPSHLVLSDRSHISKQGHADLQETVSISLRVDPFTQKDQTTHAGLIQDQIIFITVSSTEETPSS